MFPLSNNQMANTETSGTKNATERNVNFLQLASLSAEIDDATPVFELAISSPT